MSEKMKAAVLVEPGIIEIQEKDIPKPSPNEVLIKVKSVGLCGSDVHYYEHGRIGSFIVEKPIILGHESAGEVVEIGSNVKNLSVGQRVTVEPGVTCGVCEYCKSGKYNLCPEVEFLATPPYDGAFCEYIAIRSDFVYPIPDQMTFDEAAMAEPISVGIHAVRRGRLQPGETVVIMGMGPIGILTAAVAKAAGASKIIGVDLEESRLEVSKKMGVTHTVNLKQDNLLEKINLLTNGKGVDLALETAGNANALKSALSAVKRGGRVVIVGMPPEDVATLNISNIVGGEIDIYGVFRYSNTYQTAINMIENSELDLKNIMTHYYSLDEMEEAFEKAITDKTNAIKIMVRP
ncbi:NAD(P)-dependent alcohol dehydrogenase [Alkalihalobacillus sp. BA299]|uniref:NAD(P)-dependent alcohol dehydrogenase n=1 Tax=Alkalihalobacillus sp. BA299 TaxID=2815938 RepID=UPI001ADC24BE|nr:NAD(P)-dependent alcohol dehydrogenase [Alkalihalobacillus sp. BA299]